MQEKKVRFLQVDDDPIFNAVCEKHFSNRDNLDYTQVGSIAETEKALAEQAPYDVLALDLSLPDKDGFEFMPSLKALNFSGKLILISSQPPNVIDMAQTMAQRLGFNPALIVQKPITPEKLQQIDDVLDSLD